MSSTDTAQGNDTAVDASANGVAAPAVAPTLADTNKLMEWSDPATMPNIALELKDDKLSRIGQRVVEEYEIDDHSRDRWMTDNKAAMDLAMQVAEKKDTPWPNASNVIYPLITTAAIQFASRAYPAIIAGRDVVKGVVIGKDDGVPEIAPDGSPMLRVTQQGPVPVWKLEPGAKRQRADRIADHMSWQYLEEMEDWEEDTDKLLHVVPIAGSAFRKTYFDSLVGINRSDLVYPQNLVINYWAKSLARAPRATEKLKFYPLEIEEAQRADGYFVEQDYGDAPSDGGDDRDAPHEFLEQHRWLDLDEDGYPEPYIVTVHKESNKVARIVARFDPDGVLLSRADMRVRKITPVQYYTQYNFLPNPEGGIYGKGFGQLLKPINDSTNTLINELIDAGNLANSQGGFIGRGLSMHSGSVRFKKGEFKVVNIPGNKIREAIVPMEFPPPSTVLFQLLGLLIEAGKEVAAVKDVLSGEINAVTMQPTTLLALIEQGLKVFSGIYKRIYRAEKQQHDKVYRLNRIYLEEQTGYWRGDEWKEITRADYAEGAGVAPVSDPEMVSDMQRMARAGVLQAYQNDPHCDPIEIRRRIFKASQQENIDALFAKREGPTPDMILAAAELENSTIKTRAAAIKDLSAAVLNLANADKAVGDAALAVVQTQFEILKGELERLDERKQGQGGGEDADGEGVQQGGLPGLPAPSGVEGAGEAVPFGLPPRTEARPS